jgi:predicted branched-subunit amino acid permease
VGDLAAALCVNLRFLVFGVHLREYLRFLPRGKRIWLSYFMGDMTYVLFVRRFPGRPTPSASAARSCPTCGAATAGTGCSGSR